MSAFLIFFTAICICIVTWVAFACLWIVKQLKWLRAVLIPYLAVVAKLINPSKQ